MEEILAKRTITYTNTSKKNERICGTHEKCKKKRDDVPNVCEDKEVTPGKTESFTFPQREECYLIKVITPGFNILMPLSEERDTYFSEDFE